jgi:ribonucleoside-diphosphate reductase alpha chain
LTSPRCGTITPFGRDDLAHVQDEDLANETVGEDEAGNKLPQGGSDAAQKVVAEINRSISKGLIRGRSARIARSLTVLDGGAPKTAITGRGTVPAGDPVASEMVAAPITNVGVIETDELTEIASETEEDKTPIGFDTSATELHSEHQHEGQHQMGDNHHHHHGAQQSAADKYKTARQMGFTGDDCSECGGSKMVRNGTCTKCLDCGSTSGCS